MPNNDLIKEGKTLNALFDRGIQWLENKGDFNSEKRDALQDRQRSTQKMSLALGNKPVFAAFGPSQVGKSYLMKNLLSENGAPLHIDFGDDRRHDFIEDINPSGQGTESTGVVSRFTIDPCVGGDFPVQLRLLDVKDLLIIFTRAHIENIQEYRPHNESELKARMERLRSIDFQGGGNISMSVYDVRELRQYLRNKFPTFDQYWESLEQVGFWNLIELQLDRILASVDSFVQFFELLWQDHDVLSGQMSYLLEALSKLRFVSKAHVPIASILRVQREGLGLIEVDTIKSLAATEGVTRVSVKYSQDEGRHETAEVNLDALSALSKEVVLHIKISEEGLEEKTFLKHADLMDFPGAKNPTDLLEDALNDRLRGMPFLRGKIAFLFEKYSYDFEMNNLLFCVQPGQNHITELPEILNSWVRNNVGETVKERAERLKLMNGDPLLLIATKWNVELEGEISDDTTALEQRWIKKFNSIIKGDYYAGRTWPQNWSGPETTFKNYFLLRDFKYSKPLFKCDENDREIEVNLDTAKDHFENFEEYLNALKKAFLENDFVQNNIVNPEGTWDSASTPGNDGSLPILRALNKAGEISGLDHHGKEVFSSAKDSLVHQLSPLLRAADEESQRSENQEFIKRLRQVMMPIIAHTDDKLFRLQSALASSPSEFIPILREQPRNVPNTEHAIDVFFSTHGFIHHEMEVSDMIAELSNHYGLEPQEIPLYVQDQFSVDLNHLNGQEGVSVSTLALNALDTYAQEKLSMNYHFAALVQDGFDENVMIQLLDHLKNGLRNRKVAEQLDKILKRMSGEIAFGAYDIKLVARLISKWWNEYVFECDKRFYTEQEQLDLQEIGLFEKLTDSEHVENVRDSLEKLFGDQLGVDPNILTSTAGVLKQQQWLKSIERIVLMNSGGVVFDQEEQNDLRVIVDELNALDFEKCVKVNG